MLLVLVDRDRRVHTELVDRTFVCIYLASCLLTVFVEKQAHVWQSFTAQEPSYR